MSLERVIYSADVVSNGVGLPLLDAGVLVAKDGAQATIVAFGKPSELQASFGDARLERAGRAILPKAVNAHTHLDMSAYPFHALPYFRWIPEVVLANLHLRGLSGAKRGLAALGAENASAFGDIVAVPEVMDFLLQRSDIPGVAYWEVISFDPNQAEAVFRETVQKVQAWRKLERNNGVRVGLTPHTPHTVNSVLMKKLCDFARLEGIPLQIHVAEHPSELEMWRHGSGPLAQSTQRWAQLPLETVFGRTPDPALTPIQHLADLGVLEAKPTLIHMVNVSENDVQTVAQAGCSVVSCPRSNHFLECNTLPWALYAKHGVELGLGTDSVASGQTLSMRDEVFFALEQQPGLGLRQLVRWATRGGHRALGLKAPVVARGDDFSQLQIWA